MKFLFALVVAAMLFGCAGTPTGPKFESLQPAPSDVALVYVYRTHLYANRNAYPYVYVDGVQKDALRDSGYVVYRLPPGKRKIEIKGTALMWGPKDLALEPQLAAGNRYFFELSTTFSAYNEMRYVLRQVSEPEATKELANSRLSQ